MSQTHRAEPPNASMEWVVEASQPRTRLDQYLRDRLPHLSRGAIQRFIEQGDIRVNGACVKATHHPQAGETLSLHWPEVQPASAQPEEIPLDVLYEDEHLLVVNKSPGLVVHPSAGHDRGTLVNALLHHCKGQLSGIGGVARPGIVHRLDRDTSGCMVVAKHDAAHLALAEQFAERRVQKFYLAVACGHVEPDRGEIRIAIARHPSHRKRMAAVDGRGRDARTTYRVMERLKGATLVEAQLHTGRTHQVRVHFKHIGFPLVGDDTYGSRQNRRLRELTGYAAPRQLLHAARLELMHPARKEPLKVSAPLPAEFEEALAQLRML